MLSEVASCEAKVTSNPEGGWQNSTSSIGEWISSDNTVNGSGVNNPGSTWNNNWVPATQVSSPGAKMATGWLGRQSTATKYWSFQDTNGTPAGYQLGAQYGRHNTGANYAFMDGHVKFLTPNLVSCGITATNATDGPQSGAGTAAGTADTVSNPRYAATFSAM
jgi:prepilin-type processing-associated H-X9-DG protein